MQMHRTFSDRRKRMLSIDETPCRNSIVSTSFVGAKHFNDLLVVLVLPDLVVGRLGIDMLLREVERDRGLTTGEPRISTNVMVDRRSIRGMLVDRLLLHGESPYIVRVCVCVKDVEHKRFSQTIKLDNSGKLLTQENSSHALQ